MAEDFVDVAEPKVKEHPNDTVPRDGNGRPMVYPKAGGTPVALTRTTTYVKALDDGQGLARWKTRLALAGAARRADLLAEKFGGYDNEDLGHPEVRDSLDKFAEQAFAIAGGNDKRDGGTRLHTLSEYVDAELNMPDWATEEEVRTLFSYVMAMDLFDEVYDMEGFSVCVGTKTAGTYDRIVKRDGEYFIADLKTGRVDLGGMSIAQQLAIYAHSERYDFGKYPAPDRKEDPKGWDKWKKTRVENAEELYSPLVAGGDINQEIGYVIHLPLGGSTCEVLPINLKIGWDAAQASGVVRRLRSQKSRVWGDSLIS